MSGGFALCVANYGSCTNTYGSLAGTRPTWPRTASSPPCTKQGVRQPRRDRRGADHAVDTNLGILLGAELDAEFGRGRTIEAGHAPGEEPYVELRDPPKKDRE